MDAWAAYRRARERLDRHVDRAAAAVAAGGVEARVVLALIAEYRRDERDAYRRAQKGSTDALACAEDLLATRGEKL